MTTELLYVVHAYACNKYIEGNMRKIENLNATESTEESSVKVACFLTEIEQGKSGQERVQHLYSADGGPLIGWLFDEARRRMHDFKTMSRELGVTYGYINQMRTGLRSTAQISQKMAEACGKYLGVPTIVVKLICGQIPMSDFANSREGEEEIIERGLRQLQDDPQMRQILPCNLHQLPLEAKHAIVMLYAEVTGHDVLRLDELPTMLRWLQSAAAIHEANEFAAKSRH
jgi:hypothetical protein